MKRLIAVLVAAGFIAAGAAVVIAASAADTYTYEAKNGNVSFSHVKHADYVGGDCAKCHGADIAKIAIDKDAAHGAACVDCHKEMKAGPTRCNECHKR